MGGFGMGQTAPKSLLGEFYDPEELRKQQIKQMLIGAGLGLMSEGNLSGAGKGALQFGQKAQENYMDQAMLGYKMSREEKERADRDAERTAKEAERIAEQERLNAAVSALPPELRTLRRVESVMILVFF